MRARPVLIFSPLVAGVLLAGGLLGGLPACGPAAPPPELPPAPSAPPVAPEPPSDPNLVRCGVDDQPQRIGALSPPPDDELSPLLPEGEPRLLDERGLLGEMAAPAARAPITRPRRMPIPDPPLDSPPLLVSIEPGPPRMGSGAAPEGARLVGPASVDACESLAAVSDSGPLELEVELASTAVPLRVRSSRPAPGPFVRCLMERACRVKTGPAAASQRLTFPLAVKVEPPPLPPPPEPPAPTSRVEVRPAKSSTPVSPTAASQASFVVGMVLAQSNLCVSGVTPVAGQIRLRIDLRSRARSENIDFFGAPPPPNRLRPPPGPMLSITKVTPEGTVPPDLRNLVSCLTSRLLSQSVIQVDRAMKQTRVQLEVQAFLP